MLHKVIEITIASGAIIKKAWNTPRKVNYKGSTDLVTETDVAVENFLKQQLAPLLPEAVFMAEESATSYDIPPQPCWIIDPLDGTTNFVHGLPAVGTSVALWENGRAVLGVINMPILDECFYAQRGKGAYSLNGPLKVSSVERLGQAVVGTGFPYDIHRHMDIILNNLQTVLGAAQGVRRMGAAAVDLAFVAAGRLDAFYEMDLKPWDVAAGWLMVEEAGGRVSKPNGLQYSFGETIMASNGHVHYELGALLSKCDS